MFNLRREAALQTTHHVCQMGRESQPGECPDQGSMPITASLALGTPTAAGRLPLQVLSAWNPMLSRDTMVLPLRLWRRQTCLQKKSSLRGGMAAKQKGWQEQCGSRYLPATLYDTQKAPFTMPTDYKGKLFLGGGGR